MSEYINQVWDLVDSFTMNPEHVTIDQESIEELAPHIKEDIGEYRKEFSGMPACIKGGLYKDTHYEMVVYELIANAINYRYWYGRPDVRLNKAGAVRMYELLDECFNKWSPEAFSSSESCERALSDFIRSICRSRFPNLQDRVRHLEEVEKVLKDDYTWVRHLSEDINIGKETVDDTIDNLVITLPGYSSDLFMKRIFLFIMQLNRDIGAFEKEIALIPVPADYQLPKMLSWYGCLQYSDDLYNKIEKEELIPAGSLMECEIRASTILACKKLAEAAKCTMQDTDTFLWLKRKECDMSFHLTITTDY